MTGDILNSIINLIFFLIKVVIFAGLLIIVLKSLFWVIDILFGVIGKTVDTTEDVLATSIKWIFEIAFAVALFMVIFVLILNIFWFINPSGLSIDLDTNNHNSEIDLSFDFFTVSIEGSYVETNTGYLLEPNLPFSLPVIPKLPITETDSTHISLLGLKFMKKQPEEIIGRPNVSDPNGVYCFVPNRG